MAEKPARAPGMPWLSPYLTVRDAAKAIAFYERAFGFAKRNAVTSPDGAIAHAEMAWRDAVIMFAPESPSGGPCRSPASTGGQGSLSLYVYCDDVDALYARATAAGASGLDSPQDTFWGDRFCRLADPDGYVWCFATHLGEPAAKAS